MAFNDPLDLNEFFDLLPITGQEFWLDEYTVSTGYGTGVLIPSEIAPPKWRTAVRLKPMQFEEARGVLAILRRATKTYRARIYDKRFPNPAYDPDGTIISGSNVTLATVNGDGDRISLNGMPSGYKINIGDYISITYGSGKRCLVQAQEAATGNGDTFDILPVVRDGVSAGDSVALSKPYSFMLLTNINVGDSYATTVEGVSFEAIEVD